MINLTYRKNNLILVPFFYRKSFLVLDHGFFWRNYHFPKKKHTLNALSALLCLTNFLDKRMFFEIYNNFNVTHIIINYFELLFPFSGNKGILVYYNNVTVRPLVKVYYYKFVFLPGISVLTNHFTIRIYFLNLFF